MTPTQALILLTLAQATRLGQRVVTIHKDFRVAVHGLEDDEVVYSKPSAPGWIDVWWRSEQARKGYMSDKLWPLEERVAELEVALRVVTGLGLRPEPTAPTLNGRGTERLSCPNTKCDRTFTNTAGLARHQQTSGH